MAKALSCQSGQTGYAVHPTYRKTLAERTLCSSIYITNETNTRNKAGMKLLFVHVLLHK